MSASAKMLFHYVGLQREAVSAADKYLYGTCIRRVAGYLISGVY